MEKTAKQCERCTEPAIKGARFCKQCKKAVLAELKAAGFLQRAHFARGYRPQEAQENTRETKFGVWHG